MKQYSLIYVVGGVLYCIIEILWRGTTHWTMGVTGGLCFLLLHLINQKFTKMNFFEKCVLGAITITAIEFSVGCIVNLILHWHVWDYSGYFGNILGQACLFYTLMWFLLCIPGYYLSSFFQNKVFGRKLTTKPN
ncbi:MAG: putative ABC transporter permease [Clostridiales bacterium]|nr:putative ABC transporter permease [Clostridiales bacterium]